MFYPFSAKEDKLKMALFTAKGNKRKLASFSWMGRERGKETSRLRTRGREGRISRSREGKTSSYGKKQGSDGGERYLGGRVGSLL